MTVIPHPAAELNGAQVKALKDLISLRFNQDELEILVREDFNQRLHLLVDASKPFSTVVFKLIDWFERNSIIPELMQAVGVHKPGLQPDLQAIREGTPSPVAVPVDRAKLRQFGLEFRGRRVWFGYLNAYKELHELLHNLSGILPQIQEEAAERSRNGSPIPETTVEDLHQWVEDGRRWAAETEHPKAPPLAVWVPKFASAVDDLLGADAAKYASAFANLARIPDQQLRDLNIQLVACARRLKVSDLVDLLDNLPIAELGLTAQVASFRDPCQRLEQLIDDHDLCQNIDNELRLAAGIATVVPAAILGWSDVRNWLEQLAVLRPNDSRVTRTRRAADAFDATPSSDTFHDVVEKFDDLFKKTDEALLKVTNNLLRAATVLADALEHVP